MDERDAEIDVGDDVVGMEGGQLAVGFGGACVVAGLLQFDGMAGQGHGVGRLGQKGAGESRGRQTKSVTQRTGAGFIGPVCAPGSCACRSAVNFITMARSRSPSVFFFSTEVDGGESDVRFSELRGFADERLEIALCGLEFLLRQFDAGNLIADAEVSGADLQSVLQKFERLVVGLILAKQHTHAQVGIEIIRIASEFLLECLSRASLVACGQQRQPIIRIKIRQFGIELDSLLEIRQGAGEIFHHGFGRFP